MNKSLKQAIELVTKNNICSPSFLQRKMAIGYNKTIEIIDDMEELGIVGPFRGSKPREVLMSEDEAKTYLLTIE